METIRDHVVVRLLDRPTQTESGIHLPDTFDPSTGPTRKDGAEPYREPERGIIVAIGSAKTKPPGFYFGGGDSHLTDVVEGDVVLFEAFHGSLFEQEGEKYIRLNFSELLAVQGQE
jgi:co-chaperonin GroES (HSP10)